MSTSSSSANRELLTITDLVFEKIAQKCSIFDTINLSLTTPLAYNRLSHVKPTVTPTLDMTLKLKNGRIAATIDIIEGYTHLGRWSILWKNNKRTRTMDKIGEHLVTIDNLESDLSLIRTPDVLSTTATLLKTIQFLYRGFHLLNFTMNGLDFFDVNIAKPHKIWKFVSYFEKIGMIGCSFRPEDLSPLSAHFRPHQTLVIDGNVEFKEQMELKKVEIKSSKYFDSEYFQAYQAEHLEIHEWVICPDQTVELIQGWIEGKMPNLRTLKQREANQVYVPYALGAQRWFGQEERYYESEYGPIQCSFGYDIIANDGTVGTLNFDQDGILIFVVWK